MSVREDQLNLAVDFLRTSLKTSGEDLQSKRQFLKTKGLSDEEIDLAFERVRSERETESGGAIGTAAKVKRKFKFLSYHIVL
jgi:hypothetical protein